MDPFTTKIEKKKTILGLTGEIERFLDLQCKKNIETNIFFDRLNR